MKYVVILLLALSGCCKSEDDRLVKEAKAYCKCHGGVNVFSYNSYSFSLVCVDGQRSEGTGPIRDQHFYSECK